ncbi:hypothetical protein [Aureimonas psammosilenae]|uniref:hypothetical protein n=1 Tax=Aureimonas psammosilenae TaxID=2495496 RepID=UPI001260D879|nr:hypothetical protein [Aureimonas psammosilenae]
MSADPQLEATMARKWLIGHLRASDLPEATVLALILERCAATKPCRSPACAACGLAFQAAAVSIVERFIREPARSIRGRMHASTIVPGTHFVAPDALTVEAISGVGAEIANAFERCDLPPAIIGLETSFNEDKTGASDPHWCPHGHSLGQDWLSDATVRALREAFPKSHHVQRPVRVDLLDDDERARRYPFKSERSRRVTEWSESDGRNRHRVTRHRPMRPDQATRLALVEHQFGFHRRLVFHGIDEDAACRDLKGLGWPRDGP